MALISNSAVGGQLLLRELLTNRAGGFVLTHKRRRSHFVAHE
jgi:hypothetical protein